jgi:hypothetical protein
MDKVVGLELYLPKQDACSVSTRWSFGLIAETSGRRYRTPSQM